MAKLSKSDRTKLIELITRLYADHQKREAELADAVSTLRADGMSIREISRATGVPKTTVHRWLTTEKPSTPKPPRPTIKTSTEGNTTVYAVTLPAQTPNQTLKTATNGNVVTITVTAANDDVEPEKEPQPSKPPRGRGNLAVIPYPGGKARLMPSILDVIRPQTSLGLIIDFQEPFFGGGGAGFTIIESGILRDLQTVTLNDLDPDIHALWSTVQMEPEKLKARLMAYTPTSEDYEAFRLRLHPTTDPVEIALRRIVLAKLSVSGYARMGGRRNSIDTHQWNPASYCEAIDRDHRLLTRLPTRITRVDCIEILDGAGESTFVYLDPPYWEQGQKLYEHGFTYEDHVRLAEALRTTMARWVLSYDDCPEIRALYEEWANIQTVEVICSGGASGKGEPKPVKMELLITPRLKVATRKAA